MRQRSIIIAALVPLLMTAWGAHVDAAEPPAPFPEYPAIEGHVEFWKRVWSEWSLGQVAVHDVDHPSIVYEVVDLPGPIEERYSKRQRRFIDERIERWEKRLRQLEHRALSGKKLNREEQQLVLSIVQVSGNDGLRDAAGRLRTQRGLRERFLRGVEISHRYDALFREIFREAGLPEDLAFLPHVESSFQAAARSSAGAVGIWQFTRGTGRRYLTITAAVDERLDPVAAAYGAAAYLADAYAELGDWALALTSYNHGVAGMRRAVEQHGADYETIFLEYRGRLFGFASKNFYSEFLAAREIATDPERYFRGSLKLEAPLALDHVILDRRATPASIARAYDVTAADLPPINPGWHERTFEHGWSLPAGTLVWLPQGTMAALAAAGRTPELIQEATAASVYRVRRGDNLTSIAWRFGMTLEELCGVNGLDAGDPIHPDQRLLVAESATGDSYVVRHGDTLSGIARRHRMTVTELRDLNGISPKSSLIRVGQTLHVRLPTESSVHVVQTGDTLGRIASSYRVKLAELLRLNSLSLNSLIHPGQRILIPSR